MNLTLIIRTLVVALLVAGGVAGPATADQSPYADPVSDQPHPRGTIKALAADGAEIDVSYYDRSGGGEFPRVVGDIFAWSVYWPPPVAGPAVISFFNPLGSWCSPGQAWPYRTLPEAQDPCWDILFTPASKPGTYSVVFPPTVQVEGQTQVFDQWSVQEALVEGYCGTGDLGKVATNGHEHVPGRGFMTGVEHAVWTDYLDGYLGFGADIAAQYATVSPDVSAPLLSFDRTLECATVERGEPLVATYSCEEPGGLGSGVASCQLTDRRRQVQPGQSLDTSVVGTHSYTLTTTDVAGNTRSRSGTYTVVEGTTTLPDASVPENQPAGTPVGDFATSNADPEEFWAYQLVPGSGAEDNGAFRIEGTTLRTATVLDHEHRSSYSIRVRVNDVDAGVSHELPFTVTVTDVGDITVMPRTVPENLPAGTLVGEVSRVRPMDSLERTYSFVPGEGGEDNEEFALVSYLDPNDGNAQVWELRTARPLDFEAKRVHSIRLRAVYDLAQIPSEENSLRIEVTDVDDTPVTPPTVIPPTVVPPPVAQVPPEPLPPRPLTNVTRPRVTGRAKVGRTLRVRPGTWSLDAVTLTYQWLAGARTITGATTARLRLKRSHLGKRISVRVTATVAGQQVVVTARPTGRVTR